MKLIDTYYKSALNLFVIVALLTIPFSTDVYGQQAKEPNRGGKVDLRSLDVKYALDHLKVAEGYEVNLFASEKDFPLDNPVSMTWDAKGRLWVATMPVYPHYNPGDAPNDKLIILEDTDGDGKADIHTVFADKLYIPTGFELGDGGAYIAQQPNMIFAKDTDGDDVADVRVKVLHGFGTEDSHHSISAFTWGPGGALYFQEGTFHHSQIETPYGPVRLENSGVFRFEPKQFKLDVFISYNFANPWGHVFDKWGQNFVADASGGSNYFGTAFSGHIDFPFKHPRMKEFTSTKVRPTAGCEFISSRHFPKEAQGNFILNNCIGFQGIKQHQMIEEGSGFTTKEVEPLLQSSDINFRPVDLQFGPDGALYVVDWFNPLVGHMQFSVRDKRRDHRHGRIWRITHKGSPLLKPVKIAGRPVPELLELLKTYEDRVRYRVRMELRNRSAEEVSREIPNWTASLDQKDSEYEHHLLEALWVYQGIDVVEPGLLKRVLQSPNSKARAAATRVLCYWRDRIENPLGLLKVQANDEHPRVRLEAVRACSFIKNAQSAEVALEVFRHEVDYYLEYTSKETMRALEQYWLPSLASGRPFATDNPKGIAFILNRIPTTDLVKVSPSVAVYSALLSRPNVALKDRQKAIDGIAKLNQTSSITEMIKAIENADQFKKDDLRSVILDLGRMLTGQEESKLKPYQSSFKKMIQSGVKDITRQLGFASLISSNVPADEVWSYASGSMEKIIDLLDSMPLISDINKRQAFYPFIEPIMYDNAASPLASLKKNAVINGQIVHIELLGRNRILTLAEVQIFSNGKNIAPQGKAKQHSTGHGGVASRAIDGNTSGKYGDNGQSHTQGNMQNPWWEIDLGKEYPIDSITIWTRTENNGTYRSRLKDYRLKIYDKNRKILIHLQKNPAPRIKANHVISGARLKRVRYAAMRALTWIPGHEAKLFNSLEKFIIENDERDSAVAAIQRVPHSYWPKGKVTPLVTSLVKYAQSVSAKERATEDIRNALQLASELTDYLPTGEIKQTRRLINSLGVRIVVIRTVPHKMIYDRKEIAVQAGKPVEIVLENTDIMPHNIVFTQPGKMMEIAQAAERMATQPNAFAKEFVPDSPHILAKSKLLQPQKSQRLILVAPTKPGKYPYVCTFPGHWRTMSGVMHVVDDLDSFLDKTTLEAAVEITEHRAFIRDWSIADLKDSLARIDEGRSFEKGKSLFTAASCITCHRMNNIGGFVGPELSKLDNKMKRIDILAEIVEPSKVIRKEFRSYIVVTEDGKQHVGLVVKRDDKNLTLLPDPLSSGVKPGEKCEPLVIPIDEIDAEKESTVSLMPGGLLKTLTRDEILDLVAFIEARGNSEHSNYQNK